MKNVKIITIILAIILVTLVAFGGVYIQTQNRMENKVKDYTLGRELKGGRVVEIKVKTGDREEVKTNTEQLTVENYEAIKKTIIKRLDNFGAQDYTISLNKEDGTIVVELAEDENTDMYVYLLTASMNVQIKSKDGNNELLSDSMIEKSLYTYTANAKGEYQVYLDLYLTEEGQAKIKEIKNNYAILEDEVSKIEEAQKAEENKKDGDDATGKKTETTEESVKSEETRKIAVVTIGGDEFNVSRIEEDKIVLKIGEETTNDLSINNNIAVAAERAMIINSGKYPLDYEIAENRFIYSDITKEHILYLAMAIAIVMLVVFLILIIKYKIRGFLASISCIGFVSILSLVLRYTNVTISIEGIGAIILTLIINLIINQVILKEDKNIDYKKLLLNLLPIIITTLVFCFARWINLSSFGMVMFWGLVLIATYNILVTKTLLKLRESK